MSPIYAVDGKLLHESMLDDTPVCGVVRQPHNCTIEAAYILSSGCFPATLWCEGMHSRWLKRQAEGARCKACHESVRHWKVNPL